ncbi:MAG: AAA family ATPase [Candidatus Cyclobacteriaceae bacterium M3_2C_046]
MSKIISFISRKGGTGKTTNAVNLATMLFNLGYKVLLVETDTNYTLNTLRQMEVFKSKAKNERIFKIVGSEDHKILDDLKMIRQDDRLDFIIIDSAGKTTDSNIKKLCIESDVIIVPTSLTQNDLLVTFQTIEDIKPAIDHNNQLKILVLPNRIHSSTKTNTVNQALQELNATILQSYIPMKNAFAGFSTILPEKEYLNITKEILSQFEQ